MAAFAWLARLINIFCQLLFARLVAKTYGDNVYAAWTLLIRLALVRHGWVILGGALVLVAIAPFAAPTLFRQIAMLGAADRTAAFALGTVFALVMYIGQTSQRIYYGLGRGARAHLFSLVAAISGLLMAYGVSASTSSWPLTLSVCAYFGPSALVWSIAYVSSRHQAAPSDPLTDGVDVAPTRKLAARARSFWGSAIMATTVLQVDYLVLSQVANPHEIVEYNFLGKTFSLIFFVFNALLLALQPELTVALQNGSIVGELRKLRKLIVFGCFSVWIGALGIWLFRTQAFALLLPGINVDVHATNLVLFAIYFSLRVWTDAFAAVLTAASELRPFWIWVPAQAAISVVAQIVLAGYLGITGNVLGLILSFALTVSIALPVAVQRLVGRPIF